MRKMKVTYKQDGVVRARIMYFNGMYSVGGDLMAYNIQDNDIIKLEIILEASEEDTEDVTQ